MKKNKIQIFVLLFGLVLIGIGVIIGVNSANFEKNGIKTRAEIVDIKYDRNNEDTRTDVYVKYTVDGRSAINS